MSVEADCEELRLFNSKVARLEAASFAARLEGDIPQVVMTLEEIRIEQTGPVSFELIGRAWSKIDNLTQDGIDAFVLTFRMSRLALERLYVPTSHASSPLDCDQL